MKTYVRSKSEYLEGKEIIDEITLGFDLVIQNNTVVSTTSTFPGRAQFLSDIESILINEFNCNVVYKQESDRPDSLSVYFLFYYPISDDKIIQCSVFLRVSDHDVDLHSAEHRDFILDMSKRFKHSTSYSLQDEQIKVDYATLKDYPSALEEFRYQFNDLCSMWRRHYNKKGRI